MARWANLEALSSLATKTRFRFLQSRAFQSTQAVESVNGRGRRPAHARSQFASARGHFDVSNPHPGLCAFQFHGSTVMCWTQLVEPRCRSGQAAENGTQTSNADVSRLTCELSGRVGSRPSQGAKKNRSRPTRLPAVRVCLTRSGDTVSLESSDWVSLFTVLSPALLGKRHSGCRGRKHGARGRRWKKRSSPSRGEAEGSRSDTFAFGVWRKRDSGAADNKKQVDRQALEASLQGRTGRDTPARRRVYTQKRATMPGRRLMRPGCPGRLRCRRRGPGRPEQ